MEDALQIAVCEDSETDRERLLSILEDCGIPNVPHVFLSGEALLEQYAPGRYDLLLSDIYMGGITGVEAVARLRELDPDIPVAFVTTSSEFALESYRLNVLRYIEKPFRPQEIRDILMLARMKRDTAPALIVQKNGREQRIRFSSILYVEQRTHHLNITRRSGDTVDIYEKLSAVLPDLEANGFFSPHKSFAVNLDGVQSVDTELRCFVMTDGCNIPIRRESMSKARKAFEEHLFRCSREG